jgi:hypothetical protein
MFSRQLSVIRQHGLSPSALIPKGANPSADSHANIHCHA